jgi:hypothetical protein
MGVGSSMDGERLVKIYHNLTIRLKEREIRVI